MPVELWKKIFEILGIPLLTLFIIDTLRGATGTKLPGRETKVDTGMDLAMIAVGACTSIFSNDKLYDLWGRDVTLYGIVTVMVCITFVVYLAKLRRWKNKNLTWLGATFRIALGLIPNGLVTGILILGYTVQSRR